MCVHSSFIRFRLNRDSPQRYALESGVTTVNGKVAKANTILKDGDRIE